MHEFRYDWLIEDVAHDVVPLKPQHAVISDIGKPSFLLN